MEKWQENREKREKTGKLKNRDLGEAGEDGNEEKAASFPFPLQRSASALNFLALGFSRFISTIKEAPVVQRNIKTELQNCTNGFVYFEFGKMNLMIL